MADARSLVAAAATAARVGNWDDALALARAALAVDDHSPRAWALAGAALESQGKLTEARTALEKAVSLDDRDLATALSCARVQAQTGARSAARALLTYVLLRESGAPALRAEASRLLHGLDGDDSRAPTADPAARP